MSGKPQALALERVSPTLRVTADGRFEIHKRRQSYPSGVVYWSVADRQNSHLAHRQFDTLRAAVAFVQPKSAGDGQP